MASDRCRSSHNQYVYTLGESMPCTLLDPRTTPAMPWKNGGGSTLQLAIAPDGASLEDFAWRISSAQVAVDGAFSSFPGIDRSLALLTGNGLHLQRSDGRIETLHGTGAIAVFGGEETISAYLTDGPVTDLNLMTRRGAWQHELQLLRLQGERMLENDAEAMLLWNVDGQAMHCQLPGGDVQHLAPHQGILLENEQGHVGIMSGQPSLLYVGWLRKG